MIKPARINHTVEKPYSWQQITNGEWIAELLQSRIDEWSPKLFGYHMLKLGGLSSELATHQCNIKHQVCLDDKNELKNIIGDPLNLPFKEKMFDACLLIHQLDYCSDPHQLLREADRVLINDGYLIISGFNPFSAIGVASLLPWRKNNLPWSGRMFTTFRVKDWLSLLNYEVVHQENFAVMPLTKHKTCWTWLENQLGVCGSSVGGLYFIVARKRTYPLNPIKKAWSRKRSFSPVSVNYRTGHSLKWKEKLKMGD
ncbi:MAG: class I SAM-dependent methyltransferase [Aliivibrio sp.]|uniref:class I SAM-dependent methyltransferase n=1 Tax=Aliivibrio sp. TaxID=1872443 RepID=UPI001A5F3333|nr:class I SAM-dependent methyltransferase [Aliivibrio sp.]